jgi:oxygen-independent coproporphyrinogen-3 oxidase
VLGGGVGASESAGVIVDALRARDAIGAGHGVDRLYVHVPFCFHKCHYCDFYSFVDSRDQQGAFLEALEIELGSLAGVTGRLRSVFVGGGTPSLLRVDLWRRLLAFMGSCFEFADVCEFSVECNPETVTPELMETLAEGGVNRVSIGAQSFDRRHLKTLERWHDPAKVAVALRCARDAGIRRASVDLIFAIPGQSLVDLEADLDRIAELAEEGLIEHVSAYALTYEPNTAMTRRLERGEFFATDEDLEASMYETVVERFREIGFERYEVSNFARRGAECDHNLGYWRNEEWLAAGPSASGHSAGHRWKNVPRLGDWMASVRRSGGYSQIVGHEPPDAARALAERLMMGLRLRCGVDAGAITAEAGRLGRGAALTESASRAEADGYLEVRDGRWMLSKRGYLFADGVAGSMMGALE